MESSSNSSELQGVILVNVGSPLSLEETKVFLGKMFNDKAIMPFPAVMRNILSFFISKARYKKSWHKYEAIGGSPLQKNMNKIKNSLQEELGNDYIIEIAYSYSAPNIRTVLKQMLKQGIRKIIVLPLYPHHSASTSGSVINEIEKFKKENHKVELAVIPHFYNHPHFILWWQKQICEFLENEEIGEPVIIFSAHSIPKRNTEDWKIYQQQVEESCKAIADGLGYEFYVVYQSRYRKSNWLEPEIKSFLSELKHRTTKNIIIVPISFVTENLETRYDLDRDVIPYLHKELDFKNVWRVPIKSTHPNLIQAFKELIKKYSL